MVASSRFGPDPQCSSCAHLIVILSGLLLRPQLRMSIICTTLNLLALPSHEDRNPVFCPAFDTHTLTPPPQLIVILSGLLPRPELTMSMMGITFNVHALCFFAAHGLSGAASTRVGNELGEWY